MLITLQNKVLTWWIILYFLSVALKNLIKMLECSEFTGGKIKSVWNLVYHYWVEVSPWELPYSTWHPLLDILCLIPFSLDLYACANLQDLFRNSCVKGRFSWFFQAGCNARLCSICVAGKLPSPTKQTIWSFFHLVAPRHMITAISTNSTSTSLLRREYITCGTLLRVSANRRGPSQLFPTCDPSLGSPAPSHGSSDHL